MCDFYAAAFSPTSLRRANPPSEAGFSLRSRQQMAAPLKADSLKRHPHTNTHSQVATKKPSGVSTTLSSSVPPFLPCRGKKNDSMVKKKQKTARVALCGRVPPLTKRVLHSQKYSVWVRDGEGAAGSSLVGALLVAGDPVGGSAPSFSVWPSSNLGSPHPIDAARRQEEDRRRPRPADLEKKLFISESTQKNNEKTALSLAEILPERGQTRAN